MADEYLFYEEDYDDISDWDEESDHENNNNTNNVTKPIQPSPATPTKPLTNQQEPEEKKTPPHSHNKNGTTSTPQIIQSPTSLSVPYIPKSTSSSFIVHKYAIFTLKDMKQHINTLIHELSLTLNIDTEIVSLLLRRYDWKTERLMEKYLCNSLKCVHEHNLHLIHKKNDKKLLSNNDLMIECCICVNDVKISSTFSLDCNHRFCNECWTDYICSTINNKSFNSIFITCPGHKCKTPLKNSVIKQFCADVVKQWNKYENYMVQSYITCNAHKYRFCPAPGCNYIIYCNDTSPKSLINDTNTSNKCTPSPTKYKSKYKQKQQQQRQRQEKQKQKQKQVNVEKSPTKYDKLAAELQGFQFFGQSSNAKKKKATEHKKESRAAQQQQQQQQGQGHRVGSAAQEQQSVFVQCKCGFDVCFLCLEEYHAPATCSQVESWNFKCLKESENAQWIVTNTKKCPKCFTRIERNHGCNHMVCSKCQYEFCWVCMGTWKQHGIGTGGYYRCNKYKAKATMGNKQKLQEKEDEELDKFVHYFNRFHNHAQSRQFLIESSHKVLRKIKSHLNMGNDTGKSWIDVEFLQNAHDEIFFCRQILKYTYVYAYYLRTGAEKDLFEFLQQDLEKNCEILHELCEQNWKNINGEHIVNYTNITHRFVKQLLHGIAKGLTR